jgi:peptidoglycan/xylan/chitin deacetylase (PgdA/CDA1 family)
MTTVRFLRSTARKVGLQRSRIAAVRMCCERAALAAVPARVSAPRGRILCYHSVGTALWGVNDVGPARFRRHLELALGAGYHFVPADAIARDDSNPYQLAITFDDGLASVAENAGPILAEYNIPWTLFVVTNWADGQHGWSDGLLLDWRAIDRLAARGATIGSHSVSHPNFGSLPPDAAEYELSESRRRIARAIGSQPTQFAIPLGQSTNWTAQAAEAALRAGYELVYAQSAARRPKGTVARTFITRFDGDRNFRAALAGGFDHWEEWV